MTQSNALETGEQRLKSRRNKLIRYIVLAFVISAFAGAVIGMSSEWFKDGLIPFWLLIVGWVAIVLAFAWFTRDYYRRIDELDLADNLWANTVALYFYFIVLFTWYFFHEADLTGEPQHYVIAVATFAVLVLAYGIRKLGFR